jgi:hypothetical protein
MTRNTYRVKLTDAEGRVMIELQDEEGVFLSINPIVDNPKEEEQEEVDSANELTELKPSVC